MLAGAPFCPHCGHAMGGPAATRPMPVPPPVAPAAPPPVPTVAPPPVPAAVPPVVAGSCPRCGQPLKPGIRFCGSCGAPTTASPAAAAVPPPAAAGRKSSTCGCCGGLLAVLVVLVVVAGLVGFKALKTLSPDAFVGDWKIVSGKAEGLDLNDEESLYFTIQPTEGGYQFGPKQSEPAPFVLKPSGPRKLAATENNPDDPSEQGTVVFELLGMGNQLHMTITIGDENKGDVIAQRQKPAKPADSKPQP